MVLIEKEHQLKIYSKYMKEDEVIVPNGVTEIEDSCFSYSENLKNIVLPDTLKHIGKNVFMYCRELEKITIPEEVEVLPKELFSFCTSLKEVSLGNKLHTICESAFYHCTNLERIVIPENVTMIEYGAFHGCTNLREIEIRSNHIQFGMNPFEDTQWLKEKSGFVIINHTLLCYKGSPDIHEVEIPNTVERIGGNAFRDCTYLNHISIPDSVNYIDHCAFRDCINLSSITIPDSVTKMGCSVFMGCRNLQQLSIPNNTYEIDMCSFEMCDQLKEVKALNIVGLSKPLHYFEESFHVRAIMPNISLRGQDYITKQHLLYGFVTNPEYYSEEQTKEYSKYVTLLKKSVISILLEHDDVKGLQWMAEHHRIHKRTVQEEYLDPAREVNATQCISFLKQWKDKKIKN